MKHRISFLIAAMIFVSVFFTGCFGGTEVGNRAFVQLMGIEREDDVYMVSLQIYKSESGTSEPDVSKANSTAISGKGTTIHSAVAEAEAALGKKLFLGHIKLLVIGNGIKNPADELSLFLDGSVSPSCPVAFSPDPEAVINTLPEDGAFSAEHLMSVMAEEASQGSTVYTTVAKMASDTGVLNCAAALPVISSDGEKISFDGLTFAQKNGTSGKLSSDCTTGVKLLLNMFESGDKINVSVSIDGKPASAYITCAKSCLKTEITDSVLHITADIKLKTEIVENPYEIAESLVKKAVREEISENCTKAFSSAVWDNSCDIFGIKKLVRRSTPEFYDEYCQNENDYLSASVLHIKVKDSK